MEDDDGFGIFCDDGEESSGEIPCEPTRIVILSPPEGSQSDFYSDKSPGLALSERAEGQSSAPKGLWRSAVIEKGSGRMGSVNAVDLELEEEQEAGKLGEARISKRSIMKAAKEVIFSKSEVGFDGDDPANDQEANDSMSFMNENAGKGNSVCGSLDLVENGDDVDLGFAECQVKRPRLRDKAEEALLGDKANRKGRDGESPLQVCSALGTKEKAMGSIGDSMKKGAGFPERDLPDSHGVRAVALNKALVLDNPPNDAPSFKMTFLDAVKLLTTERDPSDGDENILRVAMKAGYTFSPCQLKPKP